MSRKWWRVKPSRNNRETEKLWTHASLSIVQCVALQCVVLQTLMRCFSACVYVSTCMREENIECHSSKHNKHQTRMESPIHTRLTNERIDIKTSAQGRLMFKRPMSYATRHLETADLAEALCLVVSIGDVVFETPRQKMVLSRSRILNLTPAHNASAQVRQNARGSTARQIGSRKSKQVFSLA